MVNGIFPFIGLDPMTQCAKSLGIVNSAGYIDANENMETAVKGIFVAGDVRNKQLRQVVTATNDGAIAGQYIASLKIKVTDGYIWLLFYQMKKKVMIGAMVSYPLGAGFVFVYD